MQRAMKWLAIVAAVLAIAVGALYLVAEKNLPMVDGAELVPGVETVQDGIVSVFVVDAGPNKVVLVDAGNDPSGAPIKAALARRGLTEASVVAILLTHGHDDHIAACQLFPTAEIYAMKDEIVGDIAVTHAIADAESFDIGELHVEAFPMPGHTPGSVAYLARGVLFFGDSAGASADGKLRMFSGDATQTAASLAALAARLESRSDVEVLAFAHTGPLDGLHALTDFAATHGGP